MWTLHVDLLETDLEDFDEHFWKALKKARTFLELPHHIVIYEGDEPEIEPLSRAGMKGLRELVGPPQAKVRIRRNLNGRTGITYIAAVMSLDGKYSGGFLVQAVRFRKDRLKVMLNDFNQPEYVAARLKEWLIPRWGELDNLQDTAGEEIVASIDQDKVLEYLPEQDRERIQTIKAIKERVDSGEKLSEACKAESTVATTYRKWRSRYANRYKGLVEWVRENK